MFCFVNNDLVRQQDARIGITDLSIIRGYGIFDFFRLKDNVPLFIDEHLDRFFISAGKVFDEVQLKRGELEARIRQLIEVNEIPVSGIRVVLTGGYSPDGYSIGKPNLIITQEYIEFPSEESYGLGVKLITYPYLRELSEIKTINYMTGIWMRKEIARAGAFDVLYHHNGLVCELTRSNFFIVNQENEIITPDRNILRGITRRKVLGIARKQFKVYEAPVSLEDLNSAKEAFLTGTTKKVLPVTHIDDFVIGDGRVGVITKLLMQGFSEFEDEFLNKNT
ncbi:aminotransferase class IV [Fulvivirga sp. 29W222]|uniref:branched-chain-amino-acid transaminase n=1 Tax=Fulvivirga marina TaxID=2494733 RepID=A0A937FSX1_9BACT|nr:aminotransferase class IV [Fulvivirga marina]MBL6444895.1 aminotransferase class IV [Fulvivirga marina]